MSTQILYKLNLAQRLLMTDIDRVMKKEIGASATQAAALIYLSGHEGATLSDLSRELLQNKSAITTLVNRMEKRELLKRKNSQTDRRATQLHTTSRGRKICMEATSFLQKRSKTLSEELTLDDLTAVNKFLDHVIRTHKEGNELSYFLR